MPLKTERNVMSSKDNIFLWSKQAAKQFPIFPMPTKNRLKWHTFWKSSKNHTGYIIKANHFNGTEQKRN